MTTTHAVAAEQFDTWIERYVHAWRTADRQDIAALFTADAEYHERPYATDWVGRDAIVDGWLSRQDWQEGGWDFTWTVTGVTGNTAKIQGTGVYAKLGTFDNKWTVTLGDDGLCTMFRMVNSEV